MALGRNKGIILATTHSSFKIVGMKGLARDSHNRAFGIFGIQVKYLRYVAIRSNLPHKEQQSGRTGAKNPE